MKRAIFVTMLAASLTFGSGAAYAFTLGPIHGPASNLSVGQMFWLLLPVFVAPIG